MTQGRKKALKQTGDHNWDLEKMQFEKDKGYITREKDYVDKDTKADDVKFAMGVKKSSRLARLLDFIS